MKIPFHIPFVTGEEEKYISKTIRAIQSNAKTEFIEECESILEEITKSQFVLLTGSCTNALEMSLLLLDIGPGDEIICPSFTYVSVVNIILARGATPIFIDCHLGNCNIDESLIERAITPNTKAIIIMHYAGIACNLNRIVHIAEKNGIALIEDAAHCIHAYHGDQHLGTIGDFGAISFHKTKNIHCIKGGAMLIKKKDNYERAIILRDMGTNKKAFANGKVNAYSWVDLGNSFSLNPLSAAFLLSQLKSSDQVTKERKELWQYYNEQLKAVNANWFNHAVHHNAHIYYIMCRNEGDRNQLISHLKKEGIDSRFHYMPLHASEMGRRYQYIYDSDNSADVSKRILRLPLYEGMSIKDIDFVVSQISRFYHEG